MKELEDQLTRTLQHLTEVYQELRKVQEQQDVITKALDDVNAQLALLARPALRFQS